MTHLTQVIFDFATVARLRLHDSYDWHQAVWQAFPGRDEPALLSLAVTASKACTARLSYQDGADVVLPTCVGMVRIKRPFEPPSKVLPTCVGMVRPQCWRGYR